MSRLKKYFKYFIIYMFIAFMLSFIFPDDKIEKVLENQDEIVELNLSKEDIEIGNVVYDEGHSELVYDFCYSLQASNICKNLSIRLDLESKIENEIKTYVRRPESIYNKDCFDGLNDALGDENRGLCEKAWQKFGCYGDTRPKLLQENPFRVKKPILCTY